MKFAEDYAARIPDLCGELKQLEKDAAGTTVPGCPFCGGEAVIKLGTVYRENVMLSIACSSCGVQTKNHITGKVWTGDVFTLSDVLARAVAVWSRRV